MPGFRCLCPFCKTSVLHQYLGRHILGKHEALLFTDRNLKQLHNNKYTVEPLCLYITEEEERYFCLGDNACIRHEATARVHVKKNPAAHKEALLKLREKYPLTGGKTDEEVSTSHPPTALLTDKERDKIQYEFAIWVLQEGIWPADSVKKIFQEKLNLILDKNKLKELYPDLVEDEDKEEEKEENEEEPLEKVTTDEIQSEWKKMYVDEQDISAEIKDHILKGLQKEKDPMARKIICDRYCSLYPNQKNQVLELCKPFLSSTLLSAPTISMGSSLTTKVREEVSKFPTIISNTKR